MKSSFDKICLAEINFLFTKNVLFSRRVCVRLKWWLVVRQETKEHLPHTHSELLKSYAELVSTVYTGKKTKREKNSTFNFLNEEDRNQKVYLQ